MLFNSTNKIIKNGNLLSIEFKPNKIIGREKEIKSLAFNLSYFFKEYPSLPNLLVYGSTGTGKTTVCNYLLDEFKKECTKKDKPIKIVRLKGSDSRTKYEIIRQIAIQLDDSLSITKSSAELRDKIIEILQEKGLNLLIFIDEIHNVLENELNSVLYFISRLGEDINYHQNNKNLLIEKKKSMVGYILVSNKMDLLNSKKIQENTKSSMTKERLVFQRYSNTEVFEIIKDRVENGALYNGRIDDETLGLIASLSIKEGEDSRYAILLLSRTSRVAEEIGSDKVDKDLVLEINQELRKNLLKELINDYPPLYLNILKIVFQLKQRDEQINSKRIFEVYCEETMNNRVNNTRISQIVTHLEKDNIVYVISKRNNRFLSIEETENEIYEVLYEKGVIE